MLPVEAGLVQLSVTVLVSASRPSTCFAHLLHMHSRRLDPYMHVGLVLVCCRGTRLLRSCRNCMPTQQVMLAAEAPRGGLPVHGLMRQSASNSTAMSHC